MNGKIHAAKTLFFRAAVGNADDGESVGYEMSILVGDNSPIILSKQTGKWFTLSWQAIIELAVEAGIDENDKDEEKDSEKTNAAQG